MTEKRFTVCTFPKGSFENVLKDNLTGDAFQFTNEYHRSICELLNKLNDENEQLKAQLYCDSEEGVCIICKHHYLEKGNLFYISKCEKGHEKCSKESVRHCEDFKLKELQE